MSSAHPYIHLLKHTLAFTLWPDPLVPTTSDQYKKSPLFKKVFITAIEKLAGLARLRIARLPNHSENDRIEGRVWRNYADTMIGLHRLDNIQLCVETVIRENVAGDLIETGAWRGGACIFMRGILAALGVTDRKVYVADSFEGLPAPDESSYPADKGDQHHTMDFLAVDLESVKRNFERYGLLDQQVVFLKGWFCDTLPNAPIEKLSILRLDGDMYGSTMDALKALYPKLSPGGFCIVDDYHLDGCKQAVEDYRRDKQITAPLETIDWAGRYWRNLP